MAPADEKPAILLQLDSDAQPSVFDAVVAIDAGASHLLRHGGVLPETVRDLVHGTIFTRGPADLKRTAIFIGGSDVSTAEKLLKAVSNSFFGPFRVSVMFDPNGSNTTAAAAVLAALEGMGGSVNDAHAVVLGGTGPVGQRSARLLSGLGARVSLCSRSLERARDVAGRIREKSGGDVEGRLGDDPEMFMDAEIIIAAGAAGVVLLPGSVRSSLAKAKVLIDLNAVPPLGIEGVSATDKKVPLGNAFAWGALGVGGTKMKIHKQAIRSLFMANDKTLDAEELLEIARSLK